MARKRSPREKARWAHYRVRGQLSFCQKTLKAAYDWAHQNGYTRLELDLDMALGYLRQSQDDIPTHPSEEYLKRNS